MSIRRHQRLAILHALEAAYATDATPAAANAIVGTNVTITPLEASEESRDLMLPYMGNQGVILTGKYARLEFDVEIAGAGAAGTVPKYGSLLRTSGFAETVDPGVDVTYDIIEDGVESGTFYYLQDGVRHIILGARGNVSFDFAPGRIPRYRFTQMGLLGTITDQANVAVSQAGWTQPLEVDKDNTTMSLHGWAAVAESLKIDLGNTVTPRFLIGSKGMEITERKATGTAVVEAKSIATVDWFSAALNGTRGAMSLVHGTTDGNIVEVAAPAVQIGKPSQGQTNNIVNYSLPLNLCPQAGMDELSITVR